MTRTGKSDTTKIVLETIFELRWQPVALRIGHTNLTTTARYLNADVAQLHALNDRPGPSASNAPP